MVIFWFGRLEWSGLDFCSSTYQCILNFSSGGTGSFDRGEDIVGTASSATAQVKTWNAVTRELRVGQIVGTFVKGEYLVGQETGTNVAISDLNSDDNPDSGYAQNTTIESEADNLLDFSESNPFGNV